ncbi:MAG: hypothetical protein V2I41_07575 [Pseudomonadales bacterium]|nr:hypothetical protein [Pseudomonadales bacterium]
MLTQALLGLDKLFRLGLNFLAHCSWFRHFKCNLARCNPVALTIVALILTGCATASPRPVNTAAQKESSQSAMEVAKALLQTQEDFYAALEDRNPQAMIDAATTRNSVRIPPLADLQTKAAIRATTISMLTRIRSLALDKPLLIERIDRELEQLNQNRSSPLSSGGLYSIKKLKQGGEFIRVLELQSNTTTTVQLGSDTTVGTIVYVEHDLNEKIVLRVVNQQGTHLCSQQNPRGHLICRYRNKTPEELVATITNLGPTTTSVLFIKNL